MAIDRLQSEQGPYNSSESRFRRLGDKGGSQCHISVYGSAARLRDRSEQDCQATSAIVMPPCKPWRKHSRPTNFMAKKMRTVIGGLATMTPTSAGLSSMPGNV